MPGCKTTNDPGTAHPRFPWAALALCVASVGTAAWLWMRYSYCWDVAGEDLPQLRPDTVDWVNRLRRSGLSVAEEPPLAGRYVRFRGEIVGGAEPYFFRLADSEGAFAWLLVLDEDFPAKRHWAQREFIGRVVVVSADTPSTALPVIAFPAGRLTGASVAGLVVGAWGTFVFAVAFLHWRRHRGGRTSLEETRAGR
ncbi:MAG: hypothetical protein ACYSU0_12800 [Planctomycetota bacterium]|jgi:hypothetical protein